MASEYMYDILTLRAGSDESEVDDPDTTSTPEDNQVEPRAERVNKEVVILYQSPSGNGAMTLHQVGKHKRYH